MTEPAQGYDAGNQLIFNVADPIDPQDAATKSFTESLIAAVSLQIQTALNNAANAVFIFPDGTSHTIQDLSNKIMGNLGLNGIGYRGRTAAEAFQGIGVYPEDYCAVNQLGSLYNSTDGLIRAFSEAKRLGRPMIWPGNYSATHFDMNQPNGVTLVCGGTLTGLSTGEPNAQESVLTIRNFCDFKLYGRLVVSAGYKVHYAAAVAIYSDDGSGASQWKIDGLTTVAAQVGTRVGRRSEPDVLLSEGTFVGGESPGCPTAFELIGTQTVITFVGVNMISSTGSAPPELVTAWSQLPRCAVRTFGASYVMNGGEALITTVDTGLLFDNRPIASAQYGNRYGKMDVSATIESASPVCRFWNPEGIGSLAAGTGSVTLQSCGGFHSRNSKPIIQCADDFTGKIIATHNTMFFPGVRSVPNIDVGAASCDIVADEHSFGEGFMKGFDSIIGGRLSFGYQKIVDLSMLNQTINAGCVKTPLVFKVKPMTPGNNRFAVGYNSFSGSSTSGVFKVPDGGLKSVHVCVILDQGAPRPNSMLVLIVNGITYCAGASGDRYLNASWDVGDLTSGSEITLCYTAGAGTSTFNIMPNVQDRMSISARA